MSVSFIAGRFNSEGNYWEMVGDRDINVGGGNAIAIAGQLGYTVEDSSMECVPIDTWIAKSEIYLRNHLDKQSPAIPTVVVGQSNPLDPAPDVVFMKASEGCTVLYNGLPEGYLQDKIHKILIMAKEAKRQGATVIYAG